MHNTDFGSLTDCRSRLQNSIVTHKGTFVYISDIGIGRTPENSKLYKEYQQVRENAHHEGKTRTKAKYQKLMDAVPDYKFAMARTLDDRAKSTKIPYEELDFSFFPVGMVNYGLDKKSSSGITGAAFLTRTVGRQWKHGLAKSNIEITMVPGSPKDFHTMPRKDIFYAFNRLSRMLENSYPTVDEALNILYAKKGTNTLAFHREFALKVDEVGHCTLYHRDVRIGFMAQTPEGEGTGTFLIVGRHCYLKENLREIGVRLAKD